MSKGKSEKWLEKLARNVPREIAGPVIVAIALIVSLSTYIEQKRGPEPGTALMIVYNALGLSVAFAIVLYALSHFVATWRKSARDSTESNR